MNEEKTREWLAQNWGDDYEIRNLRNDFLAYSEGQAREESRIPGFFSLVFLALSCGLFMGYGFAFGKSSQDLSLLSRFLGYSKRDLVIGKTLGMLLTSITLVALPLAIVSIFMLCFGVSLPLGAVFAGFFLLTLNFVSYQPLMAKGVFSKVMRLRKKGKNLDNV